MTQDILKPFAHCQTCPVSQHNAFKTLPEQVLKDFSSCKSNTHYKRKQIIFYQGQNPYGVYCIGKGKIKESQTTSQGKSYLVRISQPGDLLGQHSFLTREAHSVTAEAMEDSVVCFLDQTIFNQVLQSHPKFSVQLLALLSKELQITVNRSVVLAYSSLPERMAELLLNLNYHFGTVENDGLYLINIIITRKELASMLGSTVESVVRELSRLKHRDILCDDNKHMVIKKIDALHALVR
jgi:CRP-like cAMP-binding protein